MSTTFYTERSKPPEGSIDPEDYYRIFVKLCWRGENKGLPHRLGLTLQCSQCMIHFSQNPNLPEDSAGVKTESIKLRSELESQGVSITKESFEDLLTTSHLKHNVSREVRVDLPRIEQTLQELAEFEPAPIDQWKESLQSFQSAFVVLGSNLSTIQVATAAEQLVRSIGEKEIFIQQRLGKEIFGILQSIAQLSPRECGEVLTTYILVPFQRFLTSMTPDKFKVLNKAISNETSSDILVKGMGFHLRPLLQGSEQITPLAREKIKLFVKELSLACRNVFPSLRTITTPGGEQMVSYILRAYVMGPVQRFIDPHQIPIVEQSDPSINIKLLYKALAEALAKYTQGSAIPSEVQIRIDLEKRVEAEKQYFIKRLDKMTRDEKKISLINKSLGIGEWAVGGTNSIRKYDPERYEVERLERAMAGIEDYTVEGVNEGGEEGYTHDQIVEDDY
jgi:hypothetical protein